MKLDKSGIRKLLTDFRLFLVLLVLMAGLSFVSPRFLTIGNLTNVLWSVCLIGIMASGTIYAPVTGGTDLSVGSHAALAGIILGVISIIASLAFIPIYVGLFKDIGGGGYLECLQQAGQDRTAVQQCSDELRQTMSNRLTDVPTR